MPPALIIILIGSRKRIPIPVPLFILWPLVAAVALLVALAWLLIPSSRWHRTPFAVMALGLRIFWNLHGLKVNVDAHDGTKVYINVI